MTLDEAMREANRRARIKVTPEGHTEEMHVYPDPERTGHYRVSRWMDVPQRCRETIRASITFKPAATH